MIFRNWWKIFSVALLCVFPVAHNYSCVWYPETESYRFSAFMPMSTTVTGYKTFFFTTQFLNKYDPVAELQNDRAQNISEWKAYFGNQVDSASIGNLLYTVDLESYKEILSGSSYPDYQGIKLNKFYQLLRTPKYKAVADYINLAKTSEEWVNYKDSWDEEWGEPDVNDSLPATDMQEVCYTAMQQCKDPFLRLRYAFQYIRLATYLPDKRNISAVYKTEIESYKQNTIIKHWALHYYTLYLARNGKDALATYYASQVFRLSDEKKRAAYFLFEVKKMQQAMAYAKNNDEKADILALASLKDTGKKLNAIKRIMQLSPNHYMLELLVTREINKLESALLTPQVNGYRLENYYFAPAGYSYGDDIAPVYHKEYGMQLLGYFESCANKAALKDKAFWNVAAGYTAFVLGKDSLAISYTNRADQYSRTASTGIQLQITLTRLMAEARQAKSIDAAFEERIYGSVKWLEDHSKQKEANRLLEQFMAFLSTNYNHQGDMAKAALCRRISKVYYKGPLSDFTFIYNDEDDYYEDVNSAYKSEASATFTTRYISTATNAAQAASLVSLIQRNGKTPYEKWLCDTLHKDNIFMNRLYDITGSLYLQEDKLPEAAHYYRLVEQSWWTEYEGYDQKRFAYLDANSFHAKFGYTHKHNAADTVKYTKYEFVTKLIQLKQKLQTAPDDATYIAVADAYYNLTGFGNSWQMVREFTSDVDYVYYPLYDEYYYGCRRARQYYMNALSHCTGRESQAHCCAMIAMCDRNNADFQYHSRNRDYWKKPVGKLDYASNPYFDKLLRDYKDTKYLVGLIAECRGRNAFVGYFTGDF